MTGRRGNRAWFWTMFLGLLLMGMMGSVTGCMLLREEVRGPHAPVARAPVSMPPYPRDFVLPRPLFGTNSAWNQTVVTAPVLMESDAQILVTYRVLLGDTTDLYPRGLTWTDWPYMYVNYEDYTMPIARMGTGQRDVLLCDYEGNLGWNNAKLPVAQAGGPLTVPAPAGTVRPSGPENTDADGHLVLYNPDTFTVYDFWQATTARTGACESFGGGQPGATLYEAGAVDNFDVRGKGTNPEGVSSARAVGTPLLAGLLVPEDVESDHIAHALAFAIPGLRNLSPDPNTPLPADYVYPAATTETDFYNRNPDALAAGQRIRLRSPVVDESGTVLDEHTLAPITRMFLTALRNYGAYLVDSSGGFTFYAEDIHTGVLHLSDDAINALIGQPAGSALPSDKTKWQIVLEALNLDLERIPFAVGPEFSDPAEATLSVANFEVVDAAYCPASNIYLPLTMSNHSTLQPGMGARLLKVNDFLYQLQNLDLDAIGNTAYDLVVMDYEDSDGDDARVFGAGEIHALQHSAGGDKIVLAYMSIGEAEDYRFYWEAAWDANGDGTPDSGAPAWLDIENPDWAGNYKVRYWDAGWQAIVLNYTDKLLEAGFDGAYLDIIDAYEYYAEGGRATAAQEMAEFVAAIRAHAHARDPDFVIVPQNAAELGALVPAYLDSVDGIGQEDIYYGYDDDDVMTPPAVTEEMAGYLDMFKHAGKLVLTVDYATMPTHIDDAYVKSHAQGYVPFVTVRDLDQLTINPGHQPD